MVYNNYERGSIMKTKEKIEARRIRVDEQLSLKDIATRLGVSKGTVSIWLRDLPLSKETIKSRCMKACTKGGEARSKNARDIRKKYQQDGRDMAIEHKDNPLFMGGCMMHWAEGAKAKNIAHISNTDKYFLAIWIMFVEQFFNIQKSNIILHISCYLNNGKTQRQIEAYWIKELGLPRSSLRKTTTVISHRFSTGAKKNKHPYGVCALKVYSTEMIQQIWGAIKYYANIDSVDKWLD